MASPLRFHRDLDFAYGRAEPWRRGVRRVMARNPGPFTFHGTGTYIIGRGEVAVIDPGPALETHVDAILAALEGETITHILVTHTHRDHSPATRLLQQAVAAPSFGYGPHGGDAGDGQVEEGADRDFEPDTVLGHGDSVTGAGWAVDAVHTPGHTSNHLCFGLREEGILFTGDHVMAGRPRWCRRRTETWGCTWHPCGRSWRERTAFTSRPMVRRSPSPSATCAPCWPHRKVREDQILACLTAGLHDIPDIVERLYADVDVQLHAAAARSVLAHLIDLTRRGRTVCDGPATVEARYGVAGPD